MYDFDYLYVFYNSKYLYRKSMEDEEVKIFLYVENQRLDGKVSGISWLQSYQMKYGVMLKQAGNTYIYMHEVSILQLI